MKLLGWRKVVRGTLRGFADFELAVENSHGLQILECPVNTNHNGPWVGFPGKPQLDRDGNLKRKPDGKPDYTAILKWADPETRDRFSRAAVQLLLAKHPDALE